MWNRGEGGRREEGPRREVPRSSSSKASASDSPRAGPSSSLLPPPSSLPLVLVAIDRLDKRRHTFGLLLEHLVAALRDEAPDLEVALVRSGGRGDVRVPGVRELFVPRLLERNAVYARLGPAWMRRRGAALVHFPFLYAPATWTGAPIRRVVTIHGASRAALDGDLVSRFSEKSLERTRRRLRSFDQVITVSESAKREVVEHYRLPPERVTVVYNGVGYGFNPGAGDPRVLEKYDVRRPYVLTISTIKPKKNVAAAVRAFGALLARHPGLPHALVLVGYTASGYAEVDDLIRELGLADRVVRTGWVESAEIPAFYAGASALLFPSLHEGFGLPVVEAMASGCPVAASRVYSIPEVGGDAILTFDPLDLDDMARELERAILDEPLRRRLVLDGLARAERFRWAESARRTAAVYREVLGRASGNTSSFEPGSRRPAPDTQSR